MRLANSDAAAVGERAQMMGLMLKSTAGLWRWRGQREGISAALSAEILDSTIAVSLSRRHRRPERFNDLVDGFGIVESIAWKC